MESFLQQTSANRGGSLNLKVQSVACAIRCAWEVSLCCHAQLVKMLGSDVDSAV